MAGSPTQVQVVLTDLSGRLYEGDARSLTTAKLGLPTGLAKGLYLLNVQQGQFSYQTGFAIQ